MGFPLTVIVLAGILQTSFALFDSKCIHDKRPAGIGPKCGKYICVRGLNATEKTLILSEHNKYRRLVASGQAKGLKNATLPAGLIPDLEWDDQLEDKAQKWADKCVFHHSSDVGIGQNLAKRWFGGCYSKNGMEPTAHKMQIKAWFDEIKHFDPSDVDAFNPDDYDSIIGHFTQIIWAFTEKLGCGFIYHIDVKNHYHYGQYLVCNYFPAGNWKGFPIYQTLGDE